MTAAMSDYSDVGIISRSLRKSCYFARLPAELQLEIFMHSLPRHSYPLVRRDAFPWVFLSVCPLWRDLCISTPKLWNRFEVDINRNDFVHSRGDSEPNAPLIHVIEQWIRFSKGYPRISVRLTYDPSQESSRHALDPTPSRIISLLIPHASRWQDMDFSVPSACIEPLVHSDPYPLEQLKSLKLDMKNGNVPPVRCLDIMSLGIRWKLITDLQLNLDDAHLLTLDSCLTILRQTEGLISCTLNARCIPDHSAAIVEVVELPALLRLHLVIQGARHPDAESIFVSFLEKINAEALKRLQIEWLLPMEANDIVRRRQHDGFVSFLRRLGRTLEAFELSYLPLSSAQLVECLLVIPNVKDLDLRFPLGGPFKDPITHFFFESLIYGIRNHGKRYTVLPSLRSLRLECQGRARCDYPRLVTALLKQRCTIMQEFSLYTGVKFEDLEDSSAVKRWQHKGIQVVFRSLVVR